MSPLMCSFVAGFIENKIGDLRLLYRYGWQTGSHMCLFFWERTFTYAQYTSGERTEPCGTLVCIFTAVVISPLTEILPRSFERKKVGLIIEKIIVKYSFDRTFYYIKLIRILRLSIALYCIVLC